MKHIVVPIDFSENSLQGLELAIMIGNKLGGQIELVYVQKKSTDYGTSSSEGEYNWAKEQFESIINRYKGRLYSHTKISYIIKIGKIFNEIVNQAHAFNDSFIVCSTHGASGFEEYLIGSNAFKIISSTYKPVFTIRGNNVPLNFNTIVLPIDINNDSRQKVPYTIELAKKFGSEVHIVTLSTGGSSDIQQKLLMYQKQVADYATEHKIKHVTQNLTGSNFADITLEYANKVQAKLISIMTEQSTFVLGSFAQQMLNKTTIPILSISPKEIFINSGFSTQG